MATMIPNLISDTKSDAEKNVFRWLKNDPKTNGWIVLHSYPLLKHETLMVGEADFVILAPNLGIFVLEIKGGLVERKQGAWYFIGKHGISEPKKRGPFEQAEEAVQSIMSLIKSKYGSSSHLGRLIFGYGCVFPDMIFNFSSPEFDKKLVFDQRNNGQIGEFIISLSKFWSNKFTETYGISAADKYPSKAEISEIAYYLRPNFEDLTPLKTIFSSSQNQLERLTKEQYQYLDCLEDNKRSIVIGGAGTGKTLLAIQSFIRFAQDKSLKIGFFCFNRLLGNFLKKAIPSFLISEESYVGTIHSYMLSYIKSQNKNVVVPENNLDNFYKNELPNTFYGCFNSNYDFKPFDLIIIDEAQDLFGDEYLLILDSILKDGIERGRWQLYADFENQDINSDTHITESEAKEKIGNPASFRLTINCRNTFQICQEIENVANVKYKNIINQIEGMPVDHIEYINSDDATIKINAKLDELIKTNKIKYSDIIILSPKKREDSIISKIKYKISDFCIDGHSNQAIEFSTIQSFKGLEKPIVLLIDINSYNIDKLLYVGLSRAKVGLYVFETPVAHAERVKLIVGKNNG